MVTSPLFRVSEVGDLRPENALPPMVWTFTGTSRVVMEPQ
jgi:hypothetical protein